MKEIILNVDKETNGDLTGRAGDNYEKIAFGLKIVPSMDNHFLLQRMSMVGGPGTTYNGFENSVSYDWEALGD
jgi:hypothetical protein